MGHLDFNEHRPMGLSAGHIRVMVLENARICKGLANMANFQKAIFLVMFQG